MVAIVACRAARRLLCKLGVGIILLKASYSGNSDLHLTVPMALYFIIVIHSFNNGGNLAHFPAWSASCRA